ncbi:hypothetical protein [Microvirga lotononidis]|uniref:Uncharacterized protein n=1 Tax=Microvirga lotononidis TaxID=864069 RepID=I4YPU9_9HYPH|nr:hypothetical protein [Microvirga lotononidis]EIM25991.1 hypothetical protein MicloDRAFT_00067210 [Microvirga lotononidis]WQO25900.1 hypothetical protein U0023_14410 [Microvirga lotononidis]
MWSKQNPVRELRSLLSRIEAASQPQVGLVAEVLERACPRLKTALDPNVLVLRLIEAEAWVDLGFWLIGWELPDWAIHRLSCDDSRWSCAICVRGLALNWVDDVAEFQHEDPALAVLGAFVQAQVQKAQGFGQSNVTVFRRVDRSGAASIGHEVER